MRESTRKNKNIKIEFRTVNHKWFKKRAVLTYKVSITLGGILKFGENMIKFQLSSQIF